MIHRGYYDTIQEIRDNDAPVIHSSPPNNNLVRQPSCAYSENILPVAGPLQAAAPISTEPTSRQPLKPALRKAKILSAARNILSYPQLGTLFAYK
jgi:hypothetical protein